MEDIVKNEFQFYSKLAKPLILNLPKSRDRILAAAWIKKFMDENVGTEKLRTTYLKLLLFCLQRRRLTGIFSDDPMDYDELEDLPVEYDLNELARNLLDQEQVENRERIRLEMIGDIPLFPAYTTDCSPDLTEYVAAQDIPNFGVHAFYAISKQPINKWQKSEKAILPKGTKSAIDTNIPPSNNQKDPYCTCAPKSAASAPEVEEAPADSDLPECKKKKDKEPERKKRRPKRMGQSPPSHPIGEVHRTVEEERVTPTWGTNLLEVKELSDIGKVDEPTEAQIQLEEEVSKLMEEEDEESEDEEKGDDTASKAADMMHIIDEWKQGKLDKSKAKKIPDRLTKLGDRSGIKLPKSTKAPKIAVKGMKKGKSKGKYGPKPDNLPEDYADWTEKDLEEAGLTWADLMPVDEDIDAELQRLEDEEMAEEDENVQLEGLDDYEGLTDYDQLIREAEADLERHKTTYDAGIEEDEPVVELFDDEIEEMEDEFNVSRAAEELQTASPALTSGIPVTTPRRSPTPRRSRSPEKSFAEEQDVLLQHRVSPLRAPKEDSTKIKRSGILKSRIPAPKSRTIKDPNISKVYETARTAVDEIYLQREQEDAEAERLEREFATQGGRSPYSSPRQPPQQSPGGAQRIFDPAYLEFASEFGDAQGDLEEEPCIPCSPPPLGSPTRRTPPQVYSPTTGAPLPIPEFPYEREDVGSPDRFDYMNRPPPTTPEFIRESRRRLLMDPTELQFTYDYQNVEGDVEEEQPCIPCGSPPPMTEDEEFEFLEQMYSSTQRTPPQVYSPTTGTPLRIPEFNYGREDVGDPDRFGRSPPGQQVQLPTHQEQQLERAAAMTRAWEQEVRLRQGSPQAMEIINEAGAELEGDLGRRLRVGHDKMIEESPPPGVKTPPKKIQLPPRPLFSPTTGEQLNVPTFDVAPEELDVSWEEGAEEVPELTRTRQADYLYGKTLEEFDELSKQARTDIFERCGDAYTAAVDTAPRRPQYFPSGVDIATDSPPLSLGAIVQHEIPDEFYDRNRRAMTGQSNICVGAKRREQFLKRKEWPVSQVSPITDEPYQEYLADKLAEYEYKGPVPQAQGLSPWRNEDVYYTPTQGDRTLEDLDWPLDYSPPRTPPCQLPQERPCGYESPFMPGVDSPRTPLLQRPEERPPGFESPFLPGISSPITPPLWGQYPIRRMKDYETPPSPLGPPTPLPLDAFWDPVDYIGMGLSDVSDLEDDMLPVESPQPCTPCDDRRIPPPTRRMPTPTGRRRVPLSPESDESPRRGVPMQMIARQLFTGEDQPCDPCDSETPTKPPSPVRPQPSRLPSRGQIPSRIPSRGGQIPSRIPSRRQVPSRIPSRGQISSMLPQAGVQRPSSRTGIPPAQRPAPEPAPYPGYQGPMTPVGRRVLPDQPDRLIPRQPRIGTPTGLVDRRSRRLFEGDDTGVEAPCGVCDQPQPSIMPPAPARRSPKHITPPPPQPPPVRSPWRTPEGVPGPSKRPTGLTPEGYISDFESPPRPGPPGSPKFAAAKRIKKKGRRPPSPQQPEPFIRSPKHITPPPPQPLPVRSPWITPEGVPGPSKRPTGLTPEGYISDFESPPRPGPPGSPKFAAAKRIKKKGRRPPSPQTPTEQRELPSPYITQPRVPCQRRDRTPTGQAPGQMLSRRLLQEPGEGRRYPPVEPPIEYSPIGPFVPEEWVSPPPPPPQYYEGPMYFPPEAIDAALPEQYPTIEDIREHELNLDRLREKHSRLQGIGVGPGPYIYRDSRQPLREKTRIRDIPEFTEDAYWRIDMYGRKDVDYFEDEKNYRPPSKQFIPHRPIRAYEFPKKQRSPIATKDREPCAPCGGEEDEVEIVEEEESFPSGYEDAFEEILEANLKVPPEQYPPPAGECRARSPPRERPPLEQRFGDQAYLDRSAAFLTAATQGTLSQHLSQRQFEDIADQADMLFDTAGGLFDQTPPEQIGRNYYPDILQAADQLGRAVQQYDLPQSPLPSPFLLSPGTPPGLPPQWSPASVPSGSPRTPPPRPVATMPSGGTCGPCGAGEADSRKVAKRRVPPKPTQLRETKSSQLRKQQQAKKEEQKLSPTSRMMKKRKEKAAKAAEERKKEVAAKRKAEEDARRAESMARVAEGLPGGKMRPLDYRTARGTGGAPASSAKKDVPHELDGHEDAVARKQLFGGPSTARPGPAGREGIPRGLSGRKIKGRKGPGGPTRVCRPCDSDEELAVPLSQRGPEFAEELRQHQLDFPRRQMGVVVGGGKYKRLPRRSDQAVNRMDEIGEEAGSPCVPCGEDDDYQATLQQLGITAEQAAATFDMNFLDEMEAEEAGIQEAAGSPNAIQQLEAQLRDMDAYERQQDEFWREMAADLDDEELRELGVSRASLERPGPCRPCGSNAPGPSTRPTEGRQLTQEQEQILAQLQEIEARADQLADEPQRSPVLTQFNLIEQAVIQREQEEREYFERMMGRGPEAQTQSPVRASPPQRQLTEEEEQMEFEELERQAALEVQDAGQVCPGGRSPGRTVPLDQVALHQERMMRQRLLEQQLQIQGPRIRGRPFPASGISYSPPRPQGIFGPPPYEQVPGRLPIPSPPRQVTPPRQPTPPYRTPPRPRSPGIPSPPSPPPSPPGFLEETPPYIGDMEEEDRLPAAPCRPPGPPRWSPTPSPPRAPSPPPFIPTPPSPLLFPPEIRQHVTSMARPEFDPARRRDLLQRDERRAFKAPSVGLYNVQEEEPLIPCLAGDESFMGYPVIPGERAPKRTRRYHKDKKAKRLFEKTEVSKLCRRLEKKFDLPDLPPDLQEPQEPDYILDDSIPEDLPRPIAPQWQHISPLQRLPLEPVPLAPWEGVGYRPVQPPYPQLEMPVHTDIYRGDVPVHPDLVDLVGYEPSLEIPEGMEDLGAMDECEEICFSPERYPEIDEMELDREAAWNYQPPEILKNIWLSSPKDLGVFTPPSVGRGPCGTYTPTATPPLQLLESPALADFGDEFMAPDLNVPGPSVQEFLVPTPPLEQLTSLQELKYYTYHSKGREGIKPKPMHFGGYGETPRRPIPRWYGRGGATNVIGEVDEPFSPPTPGTPPPQLPAPCSPCSPELEEFEQLEQEMEEEEDAARRRKQSRRRQKRRELEEAQRQMRLSDLTEEAERRELQRPRTPRRAPTPPRALSPPRAASPPRALSPQRIPSPPPPAVEYGPEMRPEGAPCSPCGPPPIDNRALELFLLEEMGFNASDSRPLTPPTTPEFMDAGMYDVFEGVESPPPLSPEPERPCMPCTPPTPPSPPPPPASPQRPQWQIYAEQMEREARARQEREERRQQLYQRNMEDIAQIYGPSPGPPSPGPDEDFYANIYSHQVPASFRQGDRPRTVVRDQIGKREISMRIPRHTPAPCLATSAIMEPRVRIQLPDQSRRRPPSRTRMAPTATAVRPAPPQVEQRTSAQRIAEARKHYQQIGRQKKLGTSREGEQIQGPCQRAQEQLNLEPVEDFLRQADQQAPSETRPKITPEEAQRRARERLRARKMQEQAGPSAKDPRTAPPPPGPQPFTGFLPTQVQRQMPSQQPQLQPSASRQSQQGGCGGGCGGGRPRSAGSSSQISQGRTRSATQSQRQAESTRSGQTAEGPRRVVKKTTSFKKIVTKQNK